MSPPRRDRTPRTGKFWVYERGIRVPYYGIYEPAAGQVEVYSLMSGTSVVVVPLTAMTVREIIIRYSGFEGAGLCEAITDWPWSACRFELG